MPSQTTPTAPGIIQGTEQTLGSAPSQAPTDDQAGRDTVMDEPPSLSVNTEVHYSVEQLPLGTKCMWVFVAVSAMAE